MSDLKLVADQPTQLERLLLDAAANESPSAEQRMRVRAALGLSAMTVPPPTVARAGRIATLGKAAIGGAIVASAVIALMLSGVGRKPAARAAVAVAPTSAPSPVRELPVPAVAEPTEPVVSPLPPVEPASNSQSTASILKATAKSVSSVAGVSKTPAPADSASDLGEQLRLIDAARTAVAAGNASSAAQALSTYSAKFPHGSFGQEAAVLRIETVDLQGNHGQASALARSFLAQHPNSPHVNLVQRIADRGQ